MTSLLHWKSNSATITHGELDAIYSRVFLDDSQAWAEPYAFVLDTIESEATNCLSAPEGTNFENKLVLSIAIRLEAEKHMIAKIADESFVAGIVANQTPHLLKRYKSDQGADAQSVRTLDEVALMTPENIHLNSFMYEPIVDMSDDHLRLLYKRVMDLG